MRNANEECIEGTKAQRVASSASKAAEGFRRIDAGRAMDCAMCVMPLTTTSSAIVTGPSPPMPIHPQEGSEPISAADDACASTDNRIATDVDIVSDLHLVIDLDAVADHRVADRATVNGGPCSDRNVIAKTN